MKDSPKDGRNLSAHRFPLKLSTRPPFENASASFHTRWTVKVISLPFFHKKGDSLPPVFRPAGKGPDKNTRKWLEEFFAEIDLHTLGGQEFDWNRVEIRKDKVYYQLPFPLDLRGISFLRNGLYLGDLKKNRFEPSQPLALALHKEDIEATISLSVSDERITRYLKGETLNIEPEEAAHKKGWHLLCADGYPIGFGKLVNGILKNKYPAGWRV